MKIRTSEIVSLLFTLFVLLSVSALATILPTQQRQARAQFQNDNRPPTFNRNASSEEAKTMDTREQATATRVQTELHSSFETSLRESLSPNKVVFTCDAAGLFQEFGRDAMRNSMKNQSEWLGGDEAATNRFVSETEKKFNQFVHAQIEGGEKLKSGKVLITGESFNATKARWCPLAPIC